MDPREALIALNLVGKVGPIRLRALLTRFGDAAAVLHTPARHLATVDGIGPETAAAIAGWEKTSDLAGELRRIERFGCRVLIESDDEYPPLLREIPDPPIVLYIRGSLRPADRQGIAVVGSRGATEYGHSTARRLSFQLAQAGFAIISGGARGIDTSAHLSALAARGRTAAVLGTGINRVFPPENAALFDRIAAEGAILSPFPFNRPADRQSFPIRNRIVAGMTLGTLVVEAGAASGALITANFANDYGRPVLAVPGRIDSPASHGCHELIRRGARLCEGVDDVLAEFEYLQPVPVATATDTPDPTPTGPGPKESNPGKPAGPGRQPVLSDAERELLAPLDGGPMTVDELVRASGRPASAVAAALFQLELKRVVRQLPGRRFVRRGPDCGEDAAGAGGR